MNTPFLTLGQAAKEVRCSKATLSKALKKGDLSAEKQPDGSYRIQPAELMRWNGNRSQVNTRNQAQTPKETHEETPSNLSILTENAELKARLEVLESERARERSQLEDTISDLRERLDRSEARAERLLPAPEKAAESVRRDLGWFDRLLGRKAV